MNQKTKSNSLAMAIIAIAALSVCVSTPALARDLGAAATSAVSNAKTIARLLSTLGILTGGILMQVPGASEMGKRALVAGIIGCLCSFGGPAFVNFIETVFGGA